MVTVNELVAYGNTLQAAVPSINYNKVVIDDSQLIKGLSEIKQVNNHLLYLVIPSGSNEGSDDATVSVNEMMFLILNKSDVKKKHDVFLQEMHDTQATALDVQTKMILDKEDSCGLMAWLSVESIKIDPIWAIAGCNGWTISFSLNKMI